jgi:hypothetical protein
LLELLRTGLPGLPDDVLRQRFGMVLRQFSTSWRTFSACISTAGGLPQ